MLGLALWLGMFPCLLVSIELRDPPCCGVYESRAMESVALTVAGFGEAFWGLG